MGIQEIRARFEEAQENLAGSPEAEKRAFRSSSPSTGRTDGAGVQALVRRGEKQLDALFRERERMREMKRYEREYAAAGLICGIDEAGRGPLAGPVVAGAVILPEKEILYLNDSKKLSPKKREELYDVILREAVSVGIGYALRNGSMRSISCRPPTRPCGRPYQSFPRSRPFF